MQKLYAETCLKLHYTEEALDAYKFLLFLSPKDQLFAKKVEELESIVLESISYEEVSNQKTHLRAVEENMSTDVEVLDEWEEMSHHTKKTDEELLKEIDIDGQVKIKEPELESTYFHQEFDRENDQVDDLSENNPPVVTFTLIDLYLKQQHYLLALKVVEDILKSHPHDQRALKKKEEIESYISRTEENSESVEEEQQSAGPDLSELIDAKLKENHERANKQEEMISRAYQVFLDKILERQKVYQK